MSAARQPSTKYRIVDITSSGQRLYRTWVEWGSGKAQAEPTTPERGEFGWAHDVRDAVVFESRAAAIAEAERAEDNARRYRAARGLPPRSAPVRIVPTTGGNWIAWTPATVVPIPSPPLAAPARRSR